ncbi:MAG: 4Fe-4S binding protein [Steroidobacteraceae bacterium]|nr:4Fe-4S binding protein [Steroidobacteraceae bacterium]
MPIAGLPELETDGRARAVALAALRLVDVEPVAVVEFTSHGRCLVIGPKPAALDLARKLAGKLECSVAVPGDAALDVDRVEGIQVVSGGRPMVRGALGDFEVAMVAGGQQHSIGALLSPPVTRFDLVVDLGTPALMRQAMPPLGYYAPGTDEDALAALLATLPEMRGEFEKPRYFNYNAEICAHGRNGKRACTRCIDACPAEAIVSVGNTVQVNPYLCQGGGACATVCPSGAMTYAYPRPGDLLGALRALLGDFQAAGGSSACLLLHDATSIATLERDLAGRMPERVLPVEIEEIGSVGMEAWLACLAYGTDAVVLLTSDRTPPQVVEALHEQLGTAWAILAGMGYGADCLRMVNADQPESALQALLGLPAGSSRPGARFAAPAADKRGVLRLALQHLHAQAPSPKRSVTLPPGAPFGEVRVSAATCTLCMSCVSACPTHALQDGRGLPQLNFREWDCIQCGLCERTCPEDAVSLSARFLYDQEARERPRILHEEQPVCCVACGKPFATRSMLEKLGRKLEGHWMFQTEEARRRLQMCEDCRVRDLYASEARKGR